MATQTGEATVTAAKPKKKKQLTVPQTVVEALEAVAKTMGVAVVELWAIFVRQYFVRGITEAFTGVVLCVASYFLYGAIGLWVLIPLAVALGFFYGAILLIGNPKYYAIEDIMEKVKNFKAKDEVKSNYRGYF